jgi:hypothetical protein
MTALATADYVNESLDDLRTRVTYALARAQNDANATTYVATLTTLRTDIKTGSSTEDDLDDNITIAKAGVYAADLGLDAIAEQVSKVINQGNKADPSLPQAKLYFGADTPSKFERPVLGAQLARMHPWPALLAASAVTGLPALAAPATAAVQAGDAAALAFTNAKTARSTFMLGGGKKALFDRWNALAATMFGALGALVHAQPQLNLGSDYAASFFLRGPVAKSQLPETASEAALAVAAKKDELAALEKHQATLAATDLARETEMKKAEAAILTAETTKKAADEAKVAAKDAVKAAEKLKPRKPGKPKKAKH